MEFLFQIGLIILLILLNGYFVASEFALVAIRKTRVDELARKGNFNAKLLQGALQNLESYISAIQLGITVISLILGWLGEPVLARFLEPLFAFLPLNLAFFTSHTLAIIFAFTIITFLQVVIGELAPKHIALQKTEETSLLIIGPLVFFTNIFRPIIFILNLSGRAVLKILRVDASKNRQLVHSEEEIRTLLQQSGKSGLIPKKEVEMIYNVFQLGDVPVKLVMVPKKKILAFNLTTSLGEIVKKFGTNPYSRFPIFKESINNIIGFVHIKDIYRELINSGEETKLSELKIIRKIIDVPKDKKIDAVLQNMRNKRTHLAVVQSDFGKTLGIVTLEDIIESMVGEIEDEFDISS